jgi:predicted HD superfamily hydrolase involved in NAD metabolism
MWGVTKLYLTQVPTLTTKPFSIVLSSILDDVQEKQKHYRQIHIFGVIQSALSLAQLYGVDLEKAALAGALHDCAKHVSRDETLQLLQDGKIRLTQDDLEYPAIWHGPVAAWLAKSRFGITDPEILGAVENHTLGCKEPSPLLQILMCADTTEPSRDFPGVEELRQAVRNDLRTGVLAVLKIKVSDILEKGQTPHPRIFETIKSLEN